MIYNRLREELIVLQAKFEASQLLADQAIKERDEWHARAVKSRPVDEAAAYHERMQELRKALKS
jgi:hypothetical protein